MGKTTEDQNKLLVLQSVSYRYSRRSGTQLRDPRKSHIGFFNLAIQAKIICPYTAL